MTVFLTETNKLCTKKAIDTLEKCTAAVDKIKNVVPNAQFGRSDTWSHFPKGCFLYVSDDDFKDQVFFNEHSTGHRNSNTRHICEHTGSV